MTKKIVIVGGGFGGVFTALDLQDSFDVTLISNSDHFLFKPLLYEYLSGEVEAWHIAPQYSELLSEQVKVLSTTVTGIDFSSRSVSLAGGEGLPYEALVLAPGATTNFAGVPGAAEFSVPFRELADADRLRQCMVEELDRIAPDLPPQDVRSALTFAIVGGGASGVELSTKMADLLNDAFARRALHGEPRVLVIEMGDRLVPGMGDEIRNFVEGALHQSHVEIHTQTRVVRVTEKSVTIEHDGLQTEIPTAAVVWVGGVEVNPLIKELDLEKTTRGLISVQPTLQTVSYENVFALGDIAFVPDAAPILAGTAQLALQEARLVAPNVRAFLRGDKLQTKQFEELGEVISLGTERAAILTAGKAFGGQLAHLASSLARRRQLVLRRDYASTLAAAGLSSLAWKARSRRWVGTRFQAQNRFAIIGLYRPFANTVALRISATVNVRLLTSPAFAPTWMSDTLGVPLYWPDESLNRPKDLSWIPARINV